MSRKSPIIIKTTYLSSSSHFNDSTDCDNSDDDFCFNCEESHSKHKSVEKSTKSKFKFSKCLCNINQNILQTRHAIYLLQYIVMRCHTVIVFYLLKHQLPTKWQFANKSYLTEVIMFKTYRSFFKEAFSFFSNIENNLLRRTISHIKNIYAKND